MNEVLWLWPEKTRVGRVVPKAKFYENAKVSGRLKDAFVAEVEKITWSHKLSPQVLALSGTAEVPEIQVFTVEAKSNAAVSGEVFGAIDASVQTPILFEERGTQGVRTRAAGKVIGPKGPTVSVQFVGQWVHTDSPRTPLPQALDLGRLYVQLLWPLLPLEPRPGESLSDTLDRIHCARSLRREIQGLEGRMARERQLNRKFEIRRELHERIAQYEALIGPVDH